MKLSGNTILITGSTSGITFSSLSIVQDHVKPRCGTYDVE
ncbi:putative predicted protein [Rhizobium favelukesii]|uniref:Uncharacterized protein n=1 Tax=Rhizobium favelukesii TaxID=348824 RepID=W6R9I3_9HYPH|nr:putative predicted protein [Rhizobium favelukesii]